MSLFFRAANGAEQRASLNDVLVVNGIGLRQDYQGTIVTSQTAPGVLGFAAAAQLLADIVSMLPVDAYRKDASGKSTQIAKPQLLIDPEGNGYGFGDYAAKLVKDSCYFGNHVAVVASYDGLGYPTQIVAQEPRDISVSGSSNGSQVWSIGGHRWDGGPNGRVKHFRRYPRSGPYILGDNPVVQHAATLGLSLATLRFGAAWFAEGAHPSAVLSTDQSLTAEQAQTLKQRFVEAIRGRREPAVLSGGVKYEAIQQNPDSSRLIEAMKWSGAEAARVLGPGFPGVLGYPTNDSMTYSTVESESMKLLIYSVDPWLVAFEDWLSKMLPRGQYVKFNRDALLRIDAKTRAEIFRTSLGPQEPWTFANEVREIQDLPPVAWGDEKPAIKSPIADEPAGETPSTSVPVQQPKTQES